MHAKNINLAVKWDRSMGLYLDVGSSFRGKVRTVHLGIEIPEING